MARREPVSQEIELELENTLRARLVAYAARTLGGHSGAEDVAQEALLAAQRAGIQSPGWLYAVTYRRAVDRLRRDGRASVAHEQLARKVTSEPSAESVATRRDDARQLRERLEDVGEPFRTALRLRYLDSLSFADVAQRQGTPERTARSRVARGLAQLRELFGASA
ncbi:MAG: RNA polymerase sigma factor [Planctomycetes bacterium]|nr:RNA polymerase sigma factor [Planctomycetota bacterium]